MVPNTENHDDSVARAKRATELHIRIENIKTGRSVGTEAPKGESIGQFVHRRTIELGTTKPDQGNKTPKI